jgi:hypothetical protein
MEVHYFLYQQIENNVFQRLLQKHHTTSFNKSCLIKKAVCLFVVFVFIDRWFRLLFLFIYSVLFILLNGDSHYSTIISKCLRPLTASFLYNLFIEWAPTIYSPEHWPALRLSKFLAKHLWNLCQSQKLFDFTALWTGIPHRIPSLANGHKTCDHVMLALEHALP